MSIKLKSAGRRLTLLIMLTVVVGLGAASAASATQTPVWTQNGTHIPFGTEVSYGASAVTGMNLQWTQGGMHYWIQCQTLSASGTVEDSGPGKAGTLKPTSSVEAGHFQGCNVVEVGEIQTAWNNTTCSVPKEIPLKFASGALANTPYAGGGLKLSGLEIEFVISNCPAHFIEGLNWRFWGDVNGNEGHGAWPGEVLFPEGTPLSMNASGSGANIDFGMNIHDAGFTPIIIGEEKDEKEIEEEEIAEEEELLNPGHHYWYTGGAGRKGEGARTLVPAGSPLAIAGSGDSISIEGSLSGVKTKVSCSNGTTAGSVENPAGGGNGTASVSFTFTGCTVPVPAGRSCYIEGGTIKTETMAGSLAAAETFAPMKLTASPRLALISIRGCTISSLNNNFPLTGTLMVSPYLRSGLPGVWAMFKSQNEASKLLKFGGVTAWAAGLLRAETAAGEAVTWTE